METVKEKVNPRTREFTILLYVLNCDNNRKTKWRYTQYVQTSGTLGYCPQTEQTKWKAMRVVSLPSIVGL